MKIPWDWETPRESVSEVDWKPSNQSRYTKIYYNQQIIIIKYSDGSTNGVRAVAYTIIYQPKTLSNV